MNILLYFWLKEYPHVDVEEAILNVFDFDKYNPELLDVLEQVLTKHGFASSNILSSRYIALKQAKEYLQVNVDRKSG